MKVGLQLYLGGESASPDFLGPAARAIEARGFHEVWLAEHIVLFPELTSTYPYSPDGSFPFDPRLLPLEPFTALSFIAAQTTRLRLATGISVLAQRNPVFAAKQAADVDVLSGGRLDYGIGAGWCLEEIEALGTPSARRGARTDDYVTLMKKIWTQEEFDHDSEFYRLPTSFSGPKPVQKPHPPLYFGGISAPALNRVARHGNGWFAVGMAPAAFAARVRDLHAICTAAGRDPAEIDIVVGPPSGKADMAMVEAFRDAGASQLILALSGRNLDRFLHRLDGLAETVVRPAAAL